LVIKLIDFLIDSRHQVLRLLDYSRSSRHLLVTAGDDGTVHLWDTTGRSPKVYSFTYWCSCGKDCIFHYIGSPVNFEKLLGTFILMVLYTLVGEGGAVGKPINFSLLSFPQMSWLKQHSAPTAGVCFSPSNEKVSKSLSLLLQIRKKVRKKWLQLILQTMCMSPSILISLSNALDIEFINIVST